MKKVCDTCQFRNAHGICVNNKSVYFGTRVKEGTCPMWDTNTLNIDRKDIEVYPQTIGD